MSLHAHAFTRGASCDIALMSLKPYDMQNNEGRIVLQGDLPQRVKVNIEQKQNMI
jgi:hypothetical protein